jgi:hypothetical protein
MGSCEVEMRLGRDFEKAHGKKIEGVQPGLEPTPSRVRASSFNRCATLLDGIVLLCINIYCDLLSILCITTTKLGPCSPVYSIG